MRILFLNPPFTKYAGLEGHGGKALPLNLAYLAGYLRKHSPHHKLEVLDCEGLNLSYETIEKRIKEISPDVIAITAPTPAYVQVEEVCKIIKKISPKIKTIVGGPHPSAFPQETTKNPNIDFSIIGEGEETLTELISFLEKNSSLAEVKGIAYKNESGEIIKTQPRPQIADLDSIPFPARDLFPLDIYFLPPTKRTSNKKAGNIITSRGCCYQCTYCIASVMWGHKVRFRSVKNVVDEIEECLKKYNIGEFNFHDELFTVNRKHTIAICREIKKRKLDIAWVCMCRIDFIDKELLTEMKSAGCRKVFFGLEAGDQEILNAMKKRMDINKAYDAVKLVKKVGIKAGASFMFGYLGETEKTIRKTINLAKKLNLDTVAFFIASPYPGTEFYKQAKELGLLRSDLQWKDFTLVSDNLPPLNLPHLPPKRLLEIQKKAYLEYYLRPKYILMKLKNLRPWEIKNLYDGLKILLKLK